MLEGTQGIVPPHALENVGQGSAASHLQKVKEQQQLKGKTRSKYETPNYSMPHQPA